MSIAVAVATPDGLALATDGRTIQRRAESEVPYRVASETAEKLYLLGQGIGVATYGIAMIGERTIRGLMEDFPMRPGADASGVAQDLGRYFHDQLSAATPARRGEEIKLADLRWPLGFVVAGYDSDGIGTILDVKVRGTGSTAAPAGPTTAAGGVALRGRADAIQRMLQGVDWKAVDAARIELSSDSRERMEELEYDLLLPTTVEDGASFAEFLVETQIGMGRWSDGTVAKPGTLPAAGGLVRVLTVTRAGASWVRNPGRANVSPQPGPTALERVDEAR